MSTLACHLCRIQSVEDRKLYKQYIVSWRPDTKTTLFRVSAEGSIIIWLKDRTGEKWRMMWSHVQYVVWHAASRLCSDSCLKIMLGHWLYLRAQSSLWGSLHNYDELLIPLIHASQETHCALVNLDNCFVEDCAFRSQWRTHTRQEKHMQCHKKGILREVQHFYPA